MKKKRVAFHTLGCKLNFAETSSISRSLPADKFEKVSDEETDVDMHIINTCSVTETADKKCRQLIKHLIKVNPNAFIVVMGCYAQLNPAKISSIKGVDLVLGTNEKFDIDKYIDSIEKKNNAEIHSCDLTENNVFNQAWSIGDRTRSFLKVQDGCDYKCSYCTIPKARGNSRNPDIPSIIAEAEKIAQSGVKEVVITGVNIGDFGKSTGDKFYDLLKELVQVDGIERYRISSIEPNLLTDKIIQLAVDNEKILPHFHIPLQNGNNKILGMMRRRYRREVFADKVLKVKEKMPLAGIGADVIVGFPGETEEDFEECRLFIESLPLTYLHVFPFSERPGTPAATFPNKVSPQEKDRRCKILTDVSKRKHHDFMLTNIGMKEKVLFEESNDDGMITGFTTNYLRAELPWDDSLTGKIREVNIDKLSETGRLSVSLI
ncbi:MAG: tRNA (N(6)-L-threonylcarbamoyladenosine(37)-C(2))-methylthiotransferase MtaB [Bacteroidales bacterium]|nr:tRNA (N(6)-L-threonylcarbamoyladenosine(37)-C(2))-methylthiotransferase MtaB [Bacteroidales bacterium]